MFGWPYNRGMSPTTRKRLAAVTAIRQRMLDTFRALPHVDRDVQHEEAVSRACRQLDHMVNYTSHRLYVR